MILYDTCSSVGLVRSNNSSYVAAVTVPQNVQPTATDGSAPCPVLRHGSHFSSHPTTAGGRR